MPADIDVDSLLLIGRIWRPHGVRGEMKVVPETDDPERLADLTTVFMGTTPDTAARADVDSFRLQPTKKGILLILKLAGIDAREDAEALRDASLFAMQEDLPPLEEDEYFLHDLIGLFVRTEDGTEIGVVEDVLERPAQPILVIRRDTGTQAMVPAVTEFVRQIDLDEETIFIRPIEGLLE